MRLDDILEQMARDAALHMAAGPTSEAELEELERKLGCALPAEYRSFLRTLGGGMYYQHHEIFGSRRVMIHDIELIPDALSVRQQLLDAGVPLEAPQLPLHRHGRQLHVLELGEGPRHGCVVRAGEPVEYPDLAAFLQAVVLAPESP